MSIELVEFKYGAFEVGAAAFGDARLDKFKAGLELGARVELFAELVAFKAVELIEETLVAKGALAKEESDVGEGMSMQVKSRSSRYIPLVVAEGNVDTGVLEALLRSGETTLGEVVAVVCTTVEDDSEVVTDVVSRMVDVEEDGEVSINTELEVIGVVVVTAVVVVVTVELVEIPVALLLPVACLFANSIKLRASSASCL